MSRPTLLYPMVSCHKLLCWEKVQIALFDVISQVAYHCATIDCLPWYSQYRVVDLKEPIVVSQARNRILVIEGKREG